MIRIALAAWGTPSAWLAVTTNPSVHTISHEALLAARGLLHLIFWSNPFAAGGFAGHATLRALLAGLIAGLGQGLPVDMMGQSFFWPDLLAWPGAILPGIAPGLWCACLLGASLGLLLLLRQAFSAILASARGQGVDAAYPDAWTLLASAVPIVVLRFWLRNFTVELEAAATIGLALAVTGLVLRQGQRLAAASAEAAAHGDQPAPWLAGLSGIAAGLLAFPGLSAAALLIAGALFGRCSPTAAARFALLVTALTSAAAGLLALPAASHNLSVATAFALVAAAAGAYAGGWLLLRLMRRTGPAALGQLAAYCTGAGCVLLLLGVFAR